MEKIKGLDTEQKAFVLEHSTYFKTTNLDKLNNLLKEGWKIVNTTSMSGTNVATSYCLIILEK